MAEPSAVTQPDEPSPGSVRIGQSSASAPSPQSAAPSPQQPSVAGDEPSPGSIKIGAQPQTEKKPLTAGSVFANIPRYIGQDMGHALDTEKDALARAGRGNVFGGPQALLGAAEFAGAPITGAVRAVLDPVKEKIPMDTAWGKMAYNLLFDSAVMFGPAGVETLGKELVPMAKATKNAARSLMDSGVMLTPGQISGQLGKQAEEIAKKFPVLGYFIRQAEGRTLDSFNVATVNRAISGYGKVEAKTAREALSEAENLIDAQYSSVKQLVPALLKDSTVDQEILHIQNKIGELPVGLQDQFDAILNNRVNNRFGIVGAVDGVALKKMDSELRELASSLRASADGAQRELGNAVGELRGVFRSALTRQYPKIAPQLTEVDQAYGRLEDIWRASASSATQGGRFTPGQYLQSLRQGQRQMSGRKAGDKAFVAGRKSGGDRTAIPMQEWAEDAQHVIGNKMPDSGTTERATWDLGGIIAAFNDPTGLAPMGMVFGSAPYTAMGQRAVNAASEGLPAVNAGAKEAIVQGARVAAPVEQVEGRQ